MNVVHAPDGAALAYTVRGAGAPVVLLHGGLASGAVWDDVAAALAHEFLVIVPDARGHGRSTNPAGTLSYTMLADDLAALLAAGPWATPTVVGWSDGGQVALELAVRHPAAAAALVVGGAYPDFVASGLRDVHREFAEELFGDGGDEELAELAALHDDWDALLAQTPAMWLGYGALGGTGAVDGIAVPTLVLAADRDELIGLDLSVALYRALPRGELAVVADADHAAPLDPARAGAFAAPIADFLRRHAAR